MAVKQDRIAAFREFRRRFCVSDYVLRRRMAGGSAKFARIRFRVGSVVTSEYATGVFLVVGHGYTGKGGNERGCYGCRITSRIYVRWEWIGPESMIQRRKQ